MIELQIPGWVGYELFGPHGDDIGTVTQLYRDDTTELPSWLVVDVEGEHPFVPVEGITPEGDHLVSAWNHERVAAAPHVGHRGHLSRNEEHVLYCYYGRDYRTIGDATGLVEEG